MSVFFFSPCILASYSSTKYFVGLLFGVYSRIFMHESICTCTHSQAAFDVCSNEPGVQRDAFDQTTCMQCDSHVTTNCDERLYLQTKRAQQLWGTMWGEPSSLLGLRGSPAHCLCCLCFSAGCNGLSNGSLLEERREKRAGLHAWHSRSHYTPLEDQRAASHFCSVAWRLPRCVRGGLVGVTAWLWAPACLLREKHLKTERVNHSFTTGSLCLKFSEWWRSCEETVGSFGKEQTHLYLEIGLGIRNQFWMKSRFKFVMTRDSLL